jgi:hypothetical protein
MIEIDIRRHTFDRRFTIFHLLIHMLIGMALHLHFKIKQNQKHVYLYVNENDIM